MTDVFIYEALRTPRGKGVAARDGKPGGALSHITPQELVAQLLTALKARTDECAITAASRLILGCVGQVGTQGGHMALISRLHANLPDHMATKTLNNFCVSGLTAVGDAALWSRWDEASLSLAGGVEMVSQVPFQADEATYYNDPRMMAALPWAPPVIGAEVLATLEGISKEELSDITVASHHKAEHAWKNGHYDRGVVPIKNSDGTTALAHDELIRAQCSKDKIHAAPPAFSKLGAMGFDQQAVERFPALTEVAHVHNRYHCPGMADAAALAVLGSKRAGEAHGLTPKARILAYAEASNDPVLQFSGGTTAMEQALAAAGLTLEDIDLLEVMEAFAAVSSFFTRKYAVDPARINVNGGNLAMGHPMGASGAILLTTALHELHRRGQNRALIVCHAGSGIGNAMIIERCN